MIKPMCHPSRIAEQSVKHGSAMSQAGAAEWRDHHRLRLTVFVFLFALLAIGAWVATTAHGQDPAAEQAYKKIAMHPQAATEKNSRRIIADAKRFASGESKGRFTDYYFKNFIPAALSNPEYLPQLSEWMDSYHDILDAAERSQTNFSSINDLALRVMSTLAKDNYPPVARINALAVLARLHARPPRDTRSPAEPLPAALGVMWEVYQNEGNPDGVRAAALSGMVKHVKFSFPRLPDDLKSDLTRAMTDLLDSAPPARRSEKAHAYLQRFAVDILHVLRSNDDPALGEKLVSISIERSRPDLIALHSAARLGEMGAELKGKISEPERVLDRWSRRALSVMEQELARLESMEREQTAASPPDPHDFLPEAIESRAKQRRRSGPRSNNLDELKNMGMGSGSGSRRKSAAPRTKPQKSGLAAELEQGLGGDAGPGRRALDDEDAQPAQVRASRQRLNHTLQQLFLGVTGSPRSDGSRRSGGLSASVVDDAKSLIDDWIDQMQPILDEINDLSITNEAQYKQTLRRETDALRDLLGDEPAEAPAADTAAAGEVATSS